MAVATTDVFPTTLSQSVPEGLLRHPGGKGKDYFLNLEDVVGFTYRLDVETDRLEFFAFARGNPRTWSNDVTRDNFVRTAKVASWTLEEFRPHKVDFERLRERYARSIRTGSGGARRRNTDVRSGYCWNDGEFFLVKTYFTFGQRTVEAGRVHLYRTTEAPVLFYALNGDDVEDYRRQSKMADKRFHWKDQYVFERFVLQPHSRYAVREGTTYLIVTVQKTFFSVNVVDEETWTTDRQWNEWKSPDADREFLGATNERKRRDDCNDVPATSKKSKIDVAFEECNADDASSSLYWIREVSPATSIQTSPQVCDAVLPTSLSMPSFDPSMTFLESPPTSYPVGTSLETMLLVESLQKQIADLQNQLAAYRNFQSPNS